MARKQPEPVLTATEIALAAARQALAEFAASDKHREALRETVREAVGEALGVRLTPEEAEKVRRDMMHLRSWREFSDTVRQQGISAVVKWVVAGVFTVMMIGLGMKFGLKLPGQ